MCVANMSGYMIGLNLSSAASGALYLALFFSILVVTIIARMKLRKPKGSGNLAAMLSTAILTTSLIVCSTASFRVGYTYASDKVNQQILQQILKDSGTYSNILIVKKYDDKSFKYRSESGQENNLVLCKDSIVDWQPGEKLKVFKFLQKKENGYNCKSIVGKDLGFDPYTDASTGRRIIYPY